MHGILLLDKSIAMSSNSALQKVKRLLRVKKAGHTGSLDPLATGMLPICLGEATKFSQFLLDSDKYYRVIAQLGIKTTTGDAEGEVISNLPVIGVNVESLKKVFKSFMGVIQQIPPMFSAIKQNGKPLYELARKGVTVERKARTVHIYDIQLLNFHHNQVELEVHCSKGTYIRTLIEDIGDLLGCGSYVYQLRRLAVAPYQKEKMYALEDLSNALQQGPAVLSNLVLPIETALQKLPHVQLADSAVSHFCHGQAVMIMDPTVIGVVKVLNGKGNFLGMGKALGDGRVAPKRLINPNVSNMPAM